MMQEVQITLKVTASIPATLNQVEIAALIRNDILFRTRRIFEVDVIGIREEGEIYSKEPPCAYGATSGDECSTMRERAVAGKSDFIPTCLVHPEMSSA